MTLSFLRRIALPASLSTVLDEPCRSVYEVARIESQNDLMRLAQPVRRMLADEFDIGASSNRFCPVQFGDGSVAIV
nr:hypothetical protein [Pseudomonas sp.]